MKKKSLLESYYNQHYSAYDSETEWYTDPAPNMWRFEVPSLCIEVKLTEQDGHVTEKISITPAGRLTEEEILAALQDGRVQLVTDPNMGFGTVCQIGEHWFYFGGQTAEEMTPEKYRRFVPGEDIAREITEVLADLRQHSEFIDEYRYYLYYLRETKKE